MRLKTIKLAGFKSFVDPSVMLFQSNLTAVVGPNGCGKSNIVDAIRWVIGESSAKQLRGEILTDVIFNGTTHRKPVGQASVELLFDNGNGRLGGAYAQYSEISIRREITREGQSQFYLNNTRCRRRDVTDIFLGTGLGPSSYAIIEQGVISQLIESKPEELRIYLEEAAGISKYKDRRKETETRIRNTRENLERLMDVRQEIEKQLEHLKRQASAAERFKVLKQEQRLLRAQLHALVCRSLETDLSAHQQKLNLCLTEQEGKVAEHRRVENEIEQNRALQVTSNEALNAVQEKNYHLNTDITKQEQQIHHILERQKQLEADLLQVEQVWQEAEQNLEDDNAGIASLTVELTDLEPQGELLSKTAAASSAHLQEAEQQLAKWQAQWEQFQAEVSQISLKSKVEQTQLHHLSQKLQDIERQLESLNHQRQNLNTAGLPEEIKALQAQVNTSQENVENVQTKIANLNQSIHAQRVENQQQQILCEQKRQTLQQLMQKQATLEALQKAALGKTDQSMLQWLQQQGWQEKPRLLEGLKVEQGWETAVETVLFSYLEAVCTDDYQDLFTAALEVRSGKLAVFHVKNEQAQALEAYGKEITLSSKVRSQWPMDLLAGVYAVEDVSAAMEVLPKIARHESIVTRDGIWFGPQWVRIHKKQDETEGVLQRKQMLEEIHVSVTDLQAQLQAEELALTQNRELLVSLEQDKDAKQQELHHLASQHAHFQTQLGAKQAHLDQSQKHEVMILEQLAEQEAQRVQTSSLREAAYEALKANETEANQLEEQRTILIAQRDIKQSTVQKLRQQAQTDKQMMDEYQIRLSSMQNQKHFLEQNITRSEKQLAQIQMRKQNLLTQTEQTKMPLPELEANLQLLLNQRVEIENDLNAAREKVNQIENSLRELEKQHNHAEHEIQNIRDTLSQIRIEQSSLQARMQNHMEQIEQSGFVLHQLLQELPQEENTEKSREEEWQQSLERVEARIQRLGAINLAAIDELNVLLERKNYLESQDKDLNEALNTLEEAIKKIDRETRTKLRETFDHANENFKRLFTTVFGGGQAELEFTAEEVLDAGVVIRAQPPGKRNTLLHLLSGGEKALTAIALVFALFQLNPAPFCVLDEVDAPLDEANVRRFSNLVSAMSETVQFIFISHNKVTMEMSQQLLGVTMQEAGVSRLVSVDMEAAIAMAGEPA